MSQIQINNKGAISNQQRCQNPLPVRCRSVTNNLKASKIGVNSGKFSSINPNFDFAYYQVCSDDDPGLTYTYFMARSNFVPYHLYENKVKR